LNGKLALFLDLAKSFGVRFVQKGFPALKSEFNYRALSPA
jgi:hypothetical protein